MSTEKQTTSSLTSQPQGRLPILILGATSPHQLSRLLSDTIKPLLQKHAIIIANNQHQLSLQIAHIHELIQTFHLAVSLESQRMKVVNQSLTTIPDYHANAVKAAVDLYNQQFGITTDGTDGLNDTLSKGASSNKKGIGKNEHGTPLPPLPSFKHRKQPFHEYKCKSYLISPFKMPEHQIIIDNVKQGNEQEGVIDDDNDDNDDTDTFRLDDFYSTPPQQHENGSNSTSNSSILTTTTDGVNNNTSNDHEHEVTPTIITYSTSPIYLVESDALSTLPSLAELSKSLSTLVQLVEEVGVNILALHQITTGQPR